MTSPRSPRPKWGPLLSLLFLSPVLLGVPYLAFKQHYALPEPLVDLINPQTSLPQISEARILNYSKYLSEEIGYRTVGTREHALADTWMVDQAEAFKKECEQIVQQEGRMLECEVWRQEGSGSHRFDMMSKRLYKTYVNLTNIIVRVSDGTDAGKEHAVLVNAHLDSTLPSPGAADDAISVGVMLECMRVLVNTPGWTPKYSIVFLFNHAEESLQDASHLFSTQHPIRHTVRAAVNLEAAGTTGRELLFQATSEQMIQAYSHVPRPFGTVFANDVFSSGVLLSDTDFRQFELYLNVTGLDMAIVGNSYLYHMRKDLVENIQAGVAQHFGENALALLQYLSSSESPLPTLTKGYKRPTTVYFSHLGWFFVYSFSTAQILHFSLLGMSLILVYATFIPSAPALKNSIGIFSEHGRGVVVLGVGVIGALVAANVVAVVMDKLLGKGMSWFAREYSSIVLYGPPALAGALGSQLLLGRVQERTLITSLLLTQSFTACAVQLAGLGSAAMFFLTALPLFGAVALNAFITRQGEELSLWVYAIGQATPLLTGGQLIAAICEVFVPLTGRIGADAPADHIIATIVALLGAHSFPLVLPFAHRFGRRAITRVLLILVAITAVVIALFAARSPFDVMHQKRLFVLHLENVTTQEQHLHVAAADGAPGFEELVLDITQEFGRPQGKPAPVVMDDYNGDWDTVYPFSSFLSPYKIALPKSPAEASSQSLGDGFTISAVNDVVDETAGTRSLTIRVDHPGIIWTVIAFDAHVLKWTLDNNPPDEHARHHIKEASFYGADTWTVDLVIKLPDSSSRDGKLAINFVGIQEKGMWPGKKAEKEGGGHAMVLFEKLDAWLEEKTGGTVDALLLGCVGGITTI